MRAPVELVIRKLALKLAQLDGNNYQTWASLTNDWPDTAQDYYNKARILVIFCGVNFND